MTNDNESIWPYPGSRWWKFDFHTHTPDSLDTTSWQRAVGTKDEVTPEKWLLKYMEASIDCVAVTDHNSGAWTDKLKSAYAQMKAQHSPEQPYPGFRELTIFPGVEISANSGVHVLAIFGPEAKTSNIDSLLGAVGYTSTKGDSDGETIKSVSEVIAEIVQAGAIPIPAHADANKGLLRVKPETQQCALSANTVKQSLEVDGLLAVEWGNLDNPYPKAVESLARPLARVLGSDCHNFRGIKIPGSHYTWVKMAKPTLEGLRLALLDGNGISIRRSDDGSFSPFRTPPHIIRSIDIDGTRVMGNGQPAQLKFSPFFNAIVGGRGTGKSTVVHALRLAARRESDIQLLPSDSEPRERFESFRQIEKNRDGKGVLKQETTIRVGWQHDERRLFINWGAGVREGDVADVVEDMRDGELQPSSSQSVNRNRFPVRILSQGQIAAMADKGRRVLLAIIDEAAGVDPLRDAYDEARRAFFAQCARLREIDGKLASLPEAERRLQEVMDKLKTLSLSDHAAVLQSFSRAQYQRRAVDETLEQMREGVRVLHETAERLTLDDWLPQHITEADADLLSWRKDADALIMQVQQRLNSEATLLEKGIDRLQEDQRLEAWRARSEAAIEVHKALLAQLAEKGVDDPQAFARLTQERQQLEAQVKTLQQMQDDRSMLVQQIEDQKNLLAERCQSITKRRQAFLSDRLAHNDYVRMEVVPFGFDPEAIERSLRVLIDAQDDRFSDDILKLENGDARSGLAFDMAREPANGKLKALEKVKNDLLGHSQKIGGRLRNFLERKLEKPEFADHILAWFPDDDLRIKYRRDRHWYDISEGSQGQRSAALLAFLLAFGEEPIVLDQPEDDLDNHLIYNLIVRQIRDNKLRRQLIVVTHNPNVVVNGDADLVHIMEFGNGQCYVKQSGALQEKPVREEVCQVMEGGREAFARRWKRLGKDI